MGLQQGGLVQERGDAGDYESKMGFWQKRRISGHRVCCCADIKESSQTEAECARWGRLMRPSVQQRR